MKSNTILDFFAPEASAAVEARRQSLVRLGKIGAGFTLASMPVFNLIENAYAQSSTDAVGVLNFALTLEYLEESYFRQGLATSGLLAGSNRLVFDQIRKHEAAHITLLRGAITQAGGTPVTLTDANFNFSAGGFNPFSDLQLFMALAQGFEDTGVRAYKGQAANLSTGNGRPNPTLTVALQIHSVEARHASQVRRMRGEKGWVVQNNTTLPAAFAGIYAGEQNTTQGGVNVTTITTVDAAAVTESFDEILTREQVLAIAGPFIR